MYVCKYMYKDHELPALDPKVLFTHIYIIRFLMGKRATYSFWPPSFTLHTYYVVLCVLQCIAVCVAVCCSVLQCVATPRRWDPLLIISLTTKFNATILLCGKWSSWNPSLTIMIDRNGLFIKCLCHWINLICWESVIPSFDDSDRQK